MLYTNLAISLIILAGFIGTVWISHQTYKTILEDDIENISKLSSSNIYNEINNELTKPLFVSQTMANDSFLKQWLYDEKENSADDSSARQLQEYLHAYRMKYQYDAVYMISAKSNIYYYFDGVNKIVSPENEHDHWYYDFLESGESYCLNIDSDEVNHGELTIFVDCRIEDSDGKLLGVTGVGLKMSRLQQLLAEHERDYDLQAFLIDNSGQIQACTDSTKIGTVNLFNDSQLSELQEPILSNQETMEMHWYPKDQMNNCIITRYIENLNWYLVVQKNNYAIRSSFQNLVRKDFLLITFLLALLLSLTAFIVRQYDKRMARILNTDTLTGLPNQQSFSDDFSRFAEREKDFVLFLFDVDHFKEVNDTKGHLFGNEILASIAAIAREDIGEFGSVARWGGDEFIGIIYAPQEKADELLCQIQKNIMQKCTCVIPPVTISIGATQSRKGASLDDLILEADQALYAAKKQGRNLLLHFNWL